MDRLDGVLRSLDGHGLASCLDIPDPHLPSAIAGENLFTVRGEGDCRRTSGIPGQYFGFPISGKGTDLDWKLERSHQKLGSIWSEGNREGSHPMRILLHEAVLARIQVP